ncbi:MAG: DDE-type integrase/transposase/recombinase [Nanoarchaeota archaeon]|nr:DDE-type integrase/transposase/recombinase [Nanoarchaeota archaeon]
MKHKQEQQKTKCPHCKSEEVVKRGLFETKAHGKQQRFFCKKCLKKFIVRTAFYRMRNNEKKITLCLDLFYKGVSTRKVQEHLQMFYPHNSSWVSIYSWVIKYSKMIGNFTDKLKINVGSEMQIDEVEYHRRISHKAHKGVEKNWFIDSVDPDTKFLIASDYVRNRDLKEVKKVLILAKSKTEKQISIITSDGWLAYPRAIQKIFTIKEKSNSKTFGVIHNKVNASKGEGFNHPIERLHNNLRARTKIFRGFHGSVDSARAILKGFEISYNFIIKHQAINCCPYELAIPELKEKLELNKWLSLIKLAQQQTI